MSTGDAVVLLVVTGRACMLLAVRLELYCTDKHACLSYHLLSLQGVTMPVQVRDQWGFQMTARYEMYAKLFQDYLQPQFEPQRIRETQ